MSDYKGDFTTANTVYVYFNSFDSNDPSASVTISNFLVADIKIYKNGSVTQRSSTSGFTLLDTDGIDFDSTTGIHGFSIDLSDDADVGFYAAGGEYEIIVGTITIDAATINFNAASFSIERAGGSIALLKDSSFGIAQLTRSVIWTQARAGYIDELSASNIPQDLLDIQGFTFNVATDSLNAIRDRGDAAWTTNGGGITDIINIQPLIPQSIDLADTATFRIGLMLINSLDDLPAAVEITPGTISIDTKAIGATSWTAIIVDVACSKSVGMVYYDEVFNATSGYAEGHSIRITLKGQKITVSANDYEITDTTGRIFYTEIRQTERGTNSAALASEVTAARMSELDAATSGKMANQVDLVKTDTAAILIDTAELQTDWVDGGRLDLILDIIAADTTTDIPALIATAQLDLDKITGSDGVTLATAQALYAPAIPSEVLTQVNAALDTAIAELGVAAPTATPTMRTGLMLLYMMARNRVDVDTTGTDAMKLYNNAGTQIASKLITDDGADYSESKLS